MNRRRLVALTACALGIATIAPATVAAAKLTTAQRSALALAISAPTRAPANVARDRYRHPAQTLAFFGVRPTDTVVEIWPSGGWYSEILAPYVARGGGAYIAAAPDRSLAGVRRLIDSNPTAYGSIRTANFPILASSTPPNAGTPVATGSADVVLTFRNVHNWMMSEQPFDAEAFKQIFAMLRPGGTLGVVEHRLDEKANSVRERDSGYVKTSTVRRLAETAGFRFVAATEINANAKDSRDYPEGVWTLPPTFALKNKDRAKYAAIGESDRMTLKFVKPR